MPRAHGGTGGHADRHTATPRADKAPHRGPIFQRKTRKCHQKAHLGVALSWSAVGWFGFIEPRGRCTRAAHRFGAPGELASILRGNQGNHAAKIFRLAAVLGLLHPRFFADVRPTCLPAAVCCLRLHVSTHPGWGDRPSTDGTSTPPAVCSPVDSTQAPTP